MSRILDSAWRLASILILLFALPAHPHASAQAALPNLFLVADINPHILQNSYPHRFLAAGPLSYFFTYNHGQFRFKDMSPRPYQTGGTHAKKVQNTQLAL